MNYKFKIIAGYRSDKQYSLPIEEAHKAYYLFLHPQQRGIFSTGLAIRGDQIQAIVPDYQGTMGWNDTYTLDSDDWNEIRDKGIDRAITTLLSQAKTIAYEGKNLEKPLTDILGGNRLQLPDKI